VISIENVWKSYDDLEVLKGVSFDLTEREVKVVFGPSGSGKSTLLRCINMLNPPEKGDIYLRGENITLPGVNLNAVRTRLGMVFQHFNLFAHLKAIDNVSIGLRKVKGLPKIEAQKKALEVLNLNCLVVSNNEWASLEL
jgi:polar amino acid transport system ATP-binding protein